MINTITLAMKYHNQPEAYSEVLDALNMIFTAIFALEFIFKLAAFRFKVSARHIITGDTGPMQELNLSKLVRSYRVLL